MNYRSLVLVCALSCAPGFAMEAAPAVSGDDSSKSEQARLAPAQLDELLGPIALYPDPLIAIILPASTFPTDVVLAARYLKAGGSADAIDAQPWDDSVKSLARYPEVLKWMDENLAWTSQVGSAFALQPADLLTCTQRLRAAARAAGHLTTSPEQTVVVERETIRIVPARTEVIYVPVYDPVVVYRPRTVNFYHPGPIIRFSTGYRTGIWLSYHCDWGYRTVVVINRPHRVHVWHNYPRWTCPAPSSGYYHHVWHPAPSKVHAIVHDSRPRVKPVPTPSTPNLAVARDPVPKAAAPSQAALPRPSRLGAPDRPPSATQDARASATVRPRAEPVRIDRRGQSPALTLSPLPATPSPSATSVSSPSRRIQSLTTNPSPSALRTPAPAPSPSDRNTFRTAERSQTLASPERAQAPRNFSAPAAQSSGDSARLTPRPRSRPSGSSAEAPSATPVEAEVLSPRSRRAP